MTNIVFQLLLVIFIVIITDSAAQRFHTMVLPEKMQIAQALRMRTIPANCIPSDSVVRAAMRKPACFKHMLNCKSGHTLGYQ